jgi:hypothetical protein
VSKPGVWPKQLLAMIAASHSSEAMEGFRGYEPDDQAFAIFREMVQGMLHVVPPAGSSCAIMSALLSASLEEPLGTLVPVIAGALKLDGEYMYGSDRGFDGRRVFSGEEGEDWDGHCWILFGEYIVDVSLGRTAREGHCRAQLAQRIVSKFGAHAGMIALTEKGARDVGMRYLPRYVLTPDQVLANAGGAMQKFGLMDK